MTRRLELVAVLVVVLLLALLFLLIPTQKVAAIAVVQRPEPEEQTATTVPTPAPKHDYIPTVMQGEPVLVEISYLGEADLTHFCPASCCNGLNGGTASGAPFEPGMTVAIHPDMVPCMRRVAKHS